MRFSFYSKPLFGVRMARNEQLSKAPATWFHRPSALNQAIFALPILGHLTSIQAIMIFGIGLPGMFITLQFTSELHYAAISPLIMVVIAMIRPPVMSYEARLLTVLRFSISGGRKEKKVTVSSSVLQSPQRAKRGKARRQPPSRSRWTRVPYGQGQPESRCRCHSRSGQRTACRTATRRSGCLWTA